MPSYVQIGNGFPVEYEETDNSKIIEAKADDKINTICILPERASSPKTETFIINNTTRKIMGSSAWKIVGDLICFIKN